MGMRVQDLPSESIMKPLSTVLTRYLTLRSKGVLAHNALRIAKKDAFVRHRFWLRPDLQITVSLPSDFSKEDADRLARLIVVLPIT